MDEVKSSINKMGNNAIEQSLKQLVYDRCFFLISEKIKGLQQQLADLREMIAAETKSTAGDKYETARAMIHIEQEQINRKLADALSQQALFQKIDLSILSETVIWGSLVCTDNGMFFVSTSLGKVVIDEVVVLAISPQSPLGARLLGLKKGEDAMVNDKRYSVHAIL